MSFQLRRGDDATRQTLVFDEGELIYVTDTQKVWVGDGATLGAIDLLAAGHQHDDRYYQKGEVDTLIQNLGDSQELLLDNHTQNLTVHRTINDSSAGVTNLWSAQKITQELGLKSPSVHTHDDRYYTETESDAANLIITNEIAKGEVKVDTDDVSSDVLVNKISDGPGIVTYKDATGPDNVLRIGAQIYMATIGGQMKPVYVDASKGGKVLSVEMMNIWWAESQVGNNEWMQIGHASDADSSWIMPFDGTIVGVTAHCEDAPNNKDFRLYINTSEVDSQYFTIPSGTNSIVNDQTKNTDFSANDRIRLRAAAGGSINDTAISILVKWRT